MKDVTPENGPQIGGLETPRWTVGQLVWGPMYDRLPVGSEVRDALGEWPTRIKVAGDLWRSVRDPKDVISTAGMASGQRILDRLGDGEVCDLPEPEEQSRVWFYAPGEWLRFWPFALGNDEFCRRTLVLGNRWTGAAVIALWQLNDPECPECVERREADRG